MNMNLKKMRKLSKVDLVKYVRAHRQDLPLEKVEVMNRKSLMNLASKIVTELSADKIMLTPVDKHDIIPLGSIGQDSAIEQCYSQVSVQQDQIKQSIISNQDIMVDKSENVEQNRWSPGWTDYVLSLLRKEEKIEDSPKCNGLRRLFNELIGPIFSSRITTVQAPNIQNGNRAVVECHITYYDRALGKVIDFSDAADCYPGNTKQPYSNYPTATAVTMAEARVFRKVMNLNVMAIEEAQSPDQAVSEAYQTVENAENKATEVQINIIKNISNKIGISIEKMLNKQNKTLDSLSHSDAQDTIIKLNLYQKGAANKGEDPPEDILND